MATRPAISCMPGEGRIVGGAKTVRSVRLAAADCVDVVGGVHGAQRVDVDLRRRHDVEPIQHAELAASEMVLLTRPGAIG